MNTDTRLLIESTPEAAFPNYPWSDGARAPNSETASLLHSTSGTKRQIYYQLHFPTKNYLRSPVNRLREHHRHRPRPVLALDVIVHCTGLARPVGGDVDVLFPKSKITYNRHRHRVREKHIKKGCMGRG